MDRASLTPQDYVRAALEHIDQGVSVFDEGLKLVACNARFMDMLDFPAALATPGTDFAAFMRHNAERGEYGPGTVEDLVAQRVALARQFQAHSFERQRPDGTILKVVGSPMPDGGFVTVYSDVTSERVREAEQDRQVSERTEALRANQARLSLIANEVKAGIALLDANLTFRYANLRFSRSYGMQPDAMVGLSCSQVLDPVAYDESMPRFRHALKGDSVDFDMSIKLPDGRRKDIRTFLRPEKSEEGKVVGFYVLSVDMTRQKSADRALAQAQKMEALGRLSAGIAHDFNNLLTIIVGNLDPLRERMNDPDLLENYLDPALSAAQRGTGLTQRLLTLARRQHTRPTAVRARDAMISVMKILRSSLPQDIELKVARGRSDPWMMADRGQLEMALINLTVNAGQAMSGPGRISLSCDTVRLGTEEARGLKLAAGRYCRVRVEDTGRGIDPDELRHIFDPFYTGGAGGSGLGLSMVYSFVENSAGAVRVASTPGVGSVFTLLLPHAYPPTDDGLSAPRPAPIIATEPPLALLVEDNDEVRIVLRRKLVGLGHPVVEAASAEEAVQLMTDLVDLGLMVTDVALPGGMSGTDLANRAAHLRPDLAVVLVTGHGAASVVRDAPAGAPVLQKPFADEDLADALHQALRMTTRQTPDQEAEQT